MTFNLHFLALTAPLTNGLCKVVSSLSHLSENWLRLPQIPTPSRACRQEHLCLILLAWLGACPAQAEQLPSRPFTSQDGLPFNRINDILADSHGLLWFASDAGLTRFDGYDFRTFTEDDGLRSTAVNAQAIVLLQDHRGRQANPQLIQISLQPGGDSSISAIAEDASGVIWASFLQRLYRIPDGSPAQGFSSKLFGP